MTEREYVEILRQAAIDYIEIIGRESWEARKVGDGVKIDRWGKLLSQMSPHTFARLADAWLEKTAGNKT